ncbi:MAG: hypothetical protein HZC25_08160 [Rhodospirillales bacterium]|nr:hypothetical protein [Rhodospirillales bacterium]
MDRRRLLPLIVAAVLILGGGVMFLKSRPKGPDCGPLGVAVARADRPVVALATLVGDDPKTIGFTDNLARGLTEAALIHRQPLPQPDFSTKAVPEAVAAAEEAAQFYLTCGAAAVIWGVAEKEGEVLVEDKKSKKPVTKGVYSANLWVTTAAKTSIRVPRTVTGEEANEVIFRLVLERSQSRSGQAAAVPAPAPVPDAPAQDPAPAPKPP